MLLFGLLLVLLGTNASVLPPRPNSSKPKVELYYETLCPYSKNFYLDQLEPTFQKLAEYIDVEVIPFGNVKVTNGPDGIPLFQCQHGAAECYGNRVQACVIELTQQLATRLAYVKCVFGATNWKDTYTNSESCANELKLDWSQIKTCNEGQQGLDLITKNWKRTDALVPPKKYVPWIVINGVHTEELQEAAQTNLLGYLCSQYLAGQNIAQCAGAKKPAGSLTRGVTYV